jgi:leucyl aminopeptidase
MNGKTIEVLNTDAEGRIVLADALEYAKRYQPRLVVDVATLTGASVSALGQRASAVFSNNPRIEQKIIESGELAGDFAWALPLWEEYEEEVKGTFGDVANTGKTKYGGAITAAIFLWQFIKPLDGEAAIPWVHIDMAPRMTAAENEFLAKGATGAPIGLLTQFLRKF